MQSTASKQHDSNRAPEQPFLSVLIRTQGQRIAMLAEALLCLAAQTDRSFEILLLAHEPDDDARRQLELLIERRHRLLPNIRMIIVRGGGRSEPLNQGLAAAAAEYVAFLDDDDLVMANWVEEFHRAAADSEFTAVARAQCARQVIDSVSGSEEYRSTGSRDLIFNSQFSLIEHFHHNQTPICSFAVPLAQIRQSSLQFRTDLSVTEDWDFLVRAVVSTGHVSQSATVTSLYHWWSDASGSKAIPDRVWYQDRNSVRRGWIRDGLVFDQEMTRVMIDASDDEQGVSRTEQPSLSLEQVGRGVYRRVRRRLQQLR